MKRKDFSKALHIRILTVFFISIIAFSSCSNRYEQSEQIINYLESLNDTNIKIEEVLLGEKFIANPDSIEIENFVLNIKDTTAAGIEQKMWLLTGNKMYFSDFWNKGDIVENQIKNIKRLSTQYYNIGIRPSSYILFTLIQCSNIYGQKQVLPIAFLINDKNEILKHRKVEICDEMLNMFEKNKVDQLLK